MRISRILMVVAVLCAAALAQDQSSLRGIYLSDMDTKADPCTDFFQYANGAWRAANPIPASMDRWSRRWASGELAKEQLKSLLTEVSARKDWKKGSVEQQVSDFYGSCMNESKINQAGMTPIKPMMAEIDAIKDRKGLEKILFQFHKDGIFVPFMINSMPDPHNPTEVIADVGATGLGLPDRDYYVKTEDRFKDAREKYLIHIANMFKLAGYKDADAKAAAETVFRFEHTLAEAQLDNVQLRDPKALDHKMKFEDVQKLTPEFDWSAFYKSQGLAKDALNIEQPKYMETVNRQLANAPLNEWKTYLKWHLLHNAATALSSDFVDENFAFYGKYLSGAAEMKPRWKRCVEATDANLGEALGQLYVRKYFPPEAKARMNDMLKNLRLALKETIEGLDWMSPQTKTKALEKLAAFNQKIGYPDKWKDYSEVNVQPDSYWANLMATTEFAIADDHSQIGKPVDRSRWGMTPPTSNAYYNPLLNEVVFPAGILQPPGFFINGTDAINYGAIGVIIGHEISHGFDDQGSQFDATGKLENWWTPEDLKRFQAKGQCVVDQFDNYYIEPNIHHNGKLVLGESIGDLAGAKIAYLAYQISRRGKRPEPTIDGFTPDQQFFIAWGQFRGDETRQETQRLMVQGDPHPVAKYRVIGPFSNLPAFQKAFQCKSDAPMVRPPEKRCEVW